MGNTLRCQRGLPLPIYCGNSKWDTYTRTHTHTNPTVSYTFFHVKKKGKKKKKKKKCPHTDVYTPKRLLLWEQKTGWIVRTDRLQLHEFGKMATDRVSPQERKIKSCFSNYKMTPFPLTVNSQQRWVLCTFVICHYTASWHHFKWGDAKKKHKNKLHNMTVVWESLFKETKK